jgi:hypothetical protein
VPLFASPVPAMCEAWGGEGLRCGDGELAGTALGRDRPEASTTAPIAPPTAIAAVTTPAILLTVLTRWVRVTRAVYS